MSGVLRIALFGRPHELWPVAALLAENVPPDIELILVEDASGAEEPAALGIAADHRFHRRLAISARELVQRCNGTLGLGTDFIGWRGEGSRFFSARSGALPQVNGVALHHVLLRAAMLYDDDPERLGHLYAPFRFAVRAAMAGRFAEPADDPQSPLRLLGATVWFDRAAYVALLGERCRTAGMEARDARPAGVEVDAESGLLASVDLDTGDAIAADLFVDASGALAGLAGGKGEADLRSLSGPVAFDRFVSGNGGVGADCRHMTAHALPGGVLVETPLGDGCRAELLFRSEAIDEERALELAGGSAPSRPFAAALAPRPWTGNLVRMGGAAGGLGPCRSSDMLMLYEQALRLSECLPAGRAMEIEATEYNRGLFPAIEEIRDFTLLPFILNARGDPPWAAMREARPPESLQLRLDQFRSRGRFVSYENALFDEQSWIDMLIGFGVVPERYDPRAQSLDMPRLAPVLQEMVAGFDAAIGAMPDQAKYLADFLEASEGQRPGG